MTRVSSTHCALSRLRAPVKLRTQRRHFGRQLAAIHPNNLINTGNRSSELILENEE
jgi:hypothetical protein